MKVRITEESVQYRGTFKQIMDIGLKLISGGVDDRDAKIADKVLKDNGWTEVQIGEILDKVKLTEVDTGDDLESLIQSIKLESKKHKVMMKPRQFN